MAKKSPTHLPFYRGVLMAAVQGASFDEFFQGFPLGYPYGYATGNPRVSGVEVGGAAR